MDKINLILLSAVEALFLIVATIQIYYQKKTIKVQQDCLHASEKKLTEKNKEIVGLKWQLKNPPKYKKGDKVGSYIITSCELFTPNMASILTKGISYIISLCAGSKPAMDFLDMYWEYELTHTDNGEVKKLPQYQIEKLS